MNRTGTVRLSPTFVTASPRHEMNTENSSNKLVQNRFRRILNQVPNPWRREKRHDDKVILKREVSLISGISIIVGSIIGSGIFISPKGILENSGSVPLSLIVWAFCGIITLFGALSYAELGTLIPLSGGDYVYLLKGFENLGKLGPVPSFLFLWTTLVAIGPSSSAILALTVAEYIVGTFCSNCESTQLLIKLVAVLAVTSTAYINCASVKLTTTFNNFFTSAKLTALVIIVIGGITTAFKGSIPSSLTNFEGSTTCASDIANAVYFGMWAYGGWNNLNNITEEIKNPEKNILRAIAISIPFVTVTYILTNLAYLMVMSPEDLLSSNAVALTFANNVLGAAAPIIPILVAFSAYGCGLVGCLGMARMTYVAAREGHLMDILSYVHVHNLTPVPAVVFNMLLAIIYLCFGSFESLINFLSFITWMFFGLAMVALFCLRKTRKNDHRPYKVPLICPIIMLLFSIYLLFAPIIQQPRWEYLYATLFVLSGLILYIPFVYYKIQLTAFDKLTSYLQLLLLVAPTDDTCEEDCIQHIFSIKL